MHTNTMWDLITCQYICHSIHFITGLILILKSEKIIKVEKMVVLYANKKVQELLNILVSFIYVT